MLIVETYIDFVKGKGLGLFANENINKGDKYWVRNEEFDKIIPNSILIDFNPMIQKYIKKYGVLEKSNNWYMSIDNSMFTNHSDNPNTDDYFDELGVLQYSFAVIAIKEGEEILCDYRKICRYCSEKLFFNPI